MGFGRTIARNVKLTSDAGRVWRGGLSGVRAQAEDAEKLKIGFLVGLNIVKKLGLPRLYRDAGDLKRTNERIGKSLFFADMDEVRLNGDKNLIAIGRDGIKWADTVTEDQKAATSFGALIFEAIRGKLPDQIFGKRMADGSVDSGYYIDLLNSDPGIYSVRGAIRPLATMRAYGSLLGSEAQMNLIHDVEADGLTELIPSNFKDFHGPVILGNDCIKIFFSDSHIGGGGPADDFAPNKETFFKLLDHIEHVILPNAKELGIKVNIIMDGDMAERWQFEWDEIYRSNKDVTRRLLNLGVDIYYIVGNHDMDVGAYFNKKAELPNGSSVYITDMVRDPDGVFVHGHGADPFNQTAKPGEVTEKPFGAFVTKIGKYLEYIDPNIEEKFEAVKKAFISGKGEEIYLMHFVDYIDGLKKKYFEGLNGVFKAVLGHTHKVDKGNKDSSIGWFYAKFGWKNTIYYNLGTAGGGQPPLFWGIKNRAGEIEIVQVGGFPTISPFA